MPLADRRGSHLRHPEAIGDVAYNRRRADPQARGLYLDEPRRVTHIFSLTKLYETPPQEP